jgi:plastocyanin
MSRRLIFVIVVFAIMALALAACGGASGSSTPLTVTVTATEFKYDPNTINASPGQMINLTVKNVGSVQHTWVLPTSNIKLTIDPGQTVSKTFTAPAAAGTYPFECDVPGHKEAGMVGQLIVK